MLEILKSIVERNAVINQVTYFHIYISCNIGLSIHELALKLSTSLACSEDLGGEICNPIRLGVQKNLSNLQLSVIFSHMVSEASTLSWRHKHSFFHTATSAGKYQKRSGYNFCKQEYTRLPPLRQH